MQFPSTLGSPTKFAQDDRQPSSPETLEPPEAILDTDLLRLWPVGNSGSYQEAKSMLTMSFRSLQESTNDELEQKKSAGTCSDLEILENDRLEGKGGKSEVCIHSEVVTNVDHAARLFHPEWFPFGRSPPDSAFAHFSESCEERVCSWLNKEETRPGSFMEDTYGLSGYSEFEVLDRLGGTSGVRVRRRDTSLAHSSLKNIKPCSQEVEVLSSDDSVEEWDYRDQGKLYECSNSPQIEVGKRVTRSKTQRLNGKELSEIEQARQNSLAICVSSRRHR